jgi:hypothetical protein
VEEVHAYRIKVYAIVKDIILNHPSLVIVRIAFLSFFRVCDVYVCVRESVCVHVFAGLFVPKTATQLKPQCCLIGIREPHLCPGL